MSKILLTGTSSGFGKLAVPLLLERGHTVVAAMRGGEERAREIFPEELLRHGARLIPLDLHLDRAADLEKIPAFLEDKLGGKLDALVNNAGYGLYGPFEEIPAESLRAQFEVNFFAPMLLIQKCLPALKRSRGRILCVSSVVGLVTIPFYGSYCASKFALESAVEGYAYQLKPFGVQVGLIEPGGFATSFNRAKEFSPASLVPSSPYFDRVKKFRAFTLDPRRKLGDPQVVARLIVRLCEREKVPLRNLVGKDAKLLYGLARVLPDSFRVALENWVFRKLIFKES